MISFFDVYDLLSICLDDKLLVTECILLIFFVLKRSGAFHFVFHWLILRSQMFTFGILVSYVLVKMWNISRNIDFFNMIPQCFFTQNDLYRRIDISKKKYAISFKKKVHLHFLGSSLHLWKKWSRRKIDAIIPFNFFLYSFFYLLLNSRYNPS